MKRRAGIMRRWMLNSLGIIVLLLLIFGLAFVLSVRSYYYKGVEYSLSSRLGLD